MGQEVEEKKYTSRDFRDFESRLQSETRQLESWITERKLSSEGAKFGFEMELWMLDQQLRVSPSIEEFLGNADDAQMVSELAAFNLELNGEPTPAGPRAARHLHQRAEDSWQRAVRRGAELDMRVVMIGILPTLRQQDVCFANMSPMQRYRALNQQVMRMRRGSPLEIDIQIIKQDCLCYLMEPVDLQKQQVLRRFPTT